MYDVRSVYGVTPQAPALSPNTVSPPTAMLGTDDIRSGWRGLVDPNNPLFWAGVILAVTFGAAGVAGSVRLGRAKLDVSLGQG